MSVGLWIFKNVGCPGLVVTRAPFEDGRHDELPVANAPWGVTLRWVADLPRLVRRVTPHGLSPVSDAACRPPPRPSVSPPVIQTLWRLVDGARPLHAQLQNRTWSLRRFPRERHAARRRRRSRPGCRVSRAKGRGRHPMCERPKVAPAQFLLEPVAQRHGRPRAGAIATARLFVISAGCGKAKETPKKIHLSVISR